MGIGFPVPVGVGRMTLIGFCIGLASLWAVSLMVLLVVLYNRPLREDDE